MKPPVLTRRNGGVWSVGPEPGFCGPKGGIEGMGCEERAEVGRGGRDLDGPLNWLAKVGAVWPKRRSNLVAGLVLGATAVVPAVAVGHRSVGW